DLADKYLIAEERLNAAGYTAYEVSNWSRDTATQCRHNLAYWRSDHWWGIGPGAHSHVGGVRWWNVKHPLAYASRLAAGESPAAAREVLTDAQRHDEWVLLGIRLAVGIPVSGLPPPGQEAVAGLVADGLADGPFAVRERQVRLTRQGRLLADTVVRRLLG
ncbi:MAG: coproporphyrinogen III oxidase, partial [Lapillicoccus sp.]